MAGGRPTKYNEEWVKKVQVAFYNGSNAQRFCREHKIPHSTFQNWCAKYPEFLAAFKDGKQDSQGWWLKFGLDNMFEKTFNTNLYKYMTAVQFGWNDHVQADEHIKEAIKLKLDEKVIKEIESIKAQYKKEV